MHLRDPFVRQHFSGAKSTAAFELLIILGFLGLSFVGILHHEMWRDELQAWLLARDSSSVVELYQNLRHEGHPGLWHLCLYCLSRWTSNPLSMQIFHILIATGTTSLLVKFAPFSLVNRALLAFGYFFFYEYSIVSRNYGIGILLVFWFCTLFPQRKNHCLLTALVLALLANTNVFALILSITLALTLLLDFYLSEESTSSRQQRWRLAIGCLIVLAGWGLSLIQTSRPLRSLSIARPVSSIGQDTIWEASLFQELKRFAGVVAYIVESYIPIPDIFEHKFWNTSIFSSQVIFPKILDYSAGSLLSYILSIAILIAVANLLSHKPTILFTYLFGTFSNIFFYYFVHGGGIRHYGHLFIVLVVCLWLAPFVKTYQTPQLQNWQKRLRGLGRKLFTVMLVLHVAAGVYAYGMDLRHAFSMSKDTANYIQARGYQDLPIVGATSRGVSTLSGYLDKQIYYLTNNEFGSFWQEWKEEKQETEAVLQATRNLFQAGNTEVLIVLNYELERIPIVTTDMRVEKLAQFEGSIVYSEDFNVYLARATPLKLNEPD
ncbi:MAG: hypothetical protein ACFB4I_02300 [Cyanophyceae cyanobacterium]